MTSATVASNDFLAVLKKQRAQALESIANLSGGTIGLSAGEQLGSLPVSNSDALDDALQQIKAVANIGATATADRAQNEITTITTTFMNSADSNARAAFKQQMDRCIENTKAHASDSLSRTYDKAIELISNLSQSEQSAILSFLDNASNGFSNIVNKITGFIINAIKTLPSWISHAFDAIKQFFAQIAAYIKSIF